MVFPGRWWKNSIVLASCDPMANLLCIWLSVLSWMSQKKFSIEMSKEEHSIYLSIGSVFLLESFPYSILLAFLCYILSQWNEINGRAAYARRQWKSGNHNLWGIHSALQDEISPSISSTFASTSTSCLSLHHFNDQSSNFMLLMQTNVIFL